MNTWQEVAWKINSSEVSLPSLCISLSWYRCISVSHFHGIDVYGSVHKSLKEKSKSVNVESAVHNGEQNLRFVIQDQSPLDQILVIH